MYVICNVVKTPRADTKRALMAEIHKDWSSAVHNAAKATLSKRKQTCLPLRDVSERTTRLTV